MFEHLLPLRVSLSPVSLLLLPLLFLILPFLCPALHPQCRHRRGFKTTALTQNEEYCPLAIFHPLTGYEPKLLDNFDHSETSAMIFQDESGDMYTEPSYSCDAELDDELIGKALSSPQEREEPANRRQAYHSNEESLLPARSFFAHTKYGETRIRTWFVPKNENQVAKWKTKESGFSLKDKKSKFSVKSEPRSRSTNFKTILIEEVSRN